MGVAARVRFDHPQVARLVRRTQSRRRSDVYRHATRRSSAARLNRDWHRAERAQHGRARAQRRVNLRRTAHADSRDERRAHHRRAGYHPLPLPRQRWLAWRRASGRRSHPLDQANARRNRHKCHRQKQRGRLAAAWPSESLGVMDGCSKPLALGHQRGARLASRRCAGSSRAVQRQRDRCRLERHEPHR